MNFIQNVSNFTTMTDAVYLVLCDADEMVAQIVDHHYDDRTDVTFQASDQLVPDGARVPQAKQRVKTTSDDHVEFPRVVERGDAAVDPVVGVVISRL